MHALLILIASTLLPFAASHSQTPLSDFDGGVPYSAFAKEEIKACGDIKLRSRSYAQKCHTSNNPQIKYSFNLQEAMVTPVELTEAERNATSLEGYDCGQLSLAALVFQ